MRLISLVQSQAGQVFVCACVCTFSTPVLSRMDTLPSNSPSANCCPSLLHDTHTIFDDTYSTETQRHTEGHRQHRDTEERKMIALGRFDNLEGLCVLYECAI